MLKKNLAVLLEAMGADFSYSAGRHFWQTIHIVGSVQQSSQVEIFPHVSESLSAEGWRKQKKQSYHILFHCSVSFSVYS